MSTREEDDRFIYGPGDVQESQCNNCNHFRDGAVCAAFPDGIPRAIMRNQFDHHNPYPGDHAIRFEPFEMTRELVVEQYDCVRMKDGREGAVIEIYDGKSGIGYHIEFVAEDGSTISDDIYKLEDISEVVWVSPKT